MNKILKYILISIIIAFVSCIMSIAGSYWLYGPAMDMNANVTNGIFLILDIGIVKELLGAIIKLLFGVTILVVAQMLPILTWVSVRFLKKKNIIEKSWLICLCTTIADFIFNITIFLPICDMFEIGWGNEMTGLLLAVIFLGMLVVCGVQLLVALVMMAFDNKKFKNL